MGKRGLIQVYTGDGKGKTTAAIGLACRARAHNLKVCYIYFHKDPDVWGYGEMKNLQKLGVDVFGFSKEHPFCKDVSAKKVRRECLRGLEFIKKDVYQQDKHDILILDEINISLRDGFLYEKEIMEILDSKPERLELVLTGRGAGEEIIKRADLVSEIKKIKHPFDKNIKGREGIEY